MKRMPEEGEMHFLIVLCITISTWWVLSTWIKEPFSLDKEKSNSMVLPPILEMAKNFQPTTNPMQSRRGNQWIQQTLVDEVNIRTFFTSAARHHFYKPF